MKWISRALLACLLLPLALSVAVSLTPSHLLELPRGEWTIVWYRRFFEGPIWMQALLNSLITAALSSAIAVAAALAAALVTVRGHMRGKAMLEGVLLVPMVLPGVALAAGMLVVVRATPLWGSRLSLAFGHAVLSMPVAYLVTRAAIRQVDPNLEAAARGLGAGPWRTFRFITLPLAAPGVLAACLFAMILSLNEVTITLFLATRDTETLPRVIWPNLRFAMSPLAAAASVVLLVATVPMVAAACNNLKGRWSRSTM